MTLARGNLIVEKDQITKETDGEWLEVRVDVIGPRNRCKSQPGCPKDQIQHLEDGFYIRIWQALATLLVEILRTVPRVKARLQWVE